MHPPSGLASVVGRLVESADVRLDVGYRQGRARVLTQLERRSGRSEAKNVDRDIEAMKQHVSDVINSIEPYRLPPEFLAFLEWYGGLAIFGPNESYYLSVNGVGPMVEGWYSALLGEDKVTRHGMRTYLRIARLSLRDSHPYKAVYFYLAYAQGLDAPWIIGVGPIDDEPDRILLLPEGDGVRSSMVKPLAASFVEWLTKASQTAGTFQYYPR